MELTSHRSGHKPTINISSILYDHEHEVEYVQKSHLLKRNEHGMRQIRRKPVPTPYITLLNAGINVCANQKLNTNFGPVINSFGVSPLKKLVMPSFFIMLLTIRKPLSGLSKLRFCIRVFITSNGAETMSDAEAPAMEATKFCIHEAVL